MEKVKKSSTKMFCKPIALETKHSQQIVGKEPMNASKQKKILTCFFEKISIFDFQRKK